MYLLQVVAILAWMFAGFVYCWWQGAFYEQLILGGLYVLIGTVAASGFAMLRRSLN